jgi:hypothetical protein
MRTKSTEGEQVEPSVTVGRIVRADSHTLLVDIGKSHLLCFASSASEPSIAEARVVVERLPGGVSPLLTDCVSRCRGETFVLRTSTPVANSSRSEERDLELSECKVVQTRAEMLVISCETAAAGTWISWRVDH